MKPVVVLAILLFPIAALAEPIKLPPRDAGFSISLSVPDVKPQLGMGVYDIDLFDAAPSTIDALHAAGGYVICYFSAGSFEDWRPDAARFPAGLIGRDYAGWPGERWLDIRQRAALAPILEARLDLAVAKTCDAVDPDNVDGFGNETGFDISREAQLAFNEWLAEAAHGRGLAIGLKNAAELVGTLNAAFDFAVVESCAAQEVCAAYQPFAESSKAVFQIEYRGENRDWRAVCRAADDRGFTAIQADLTLDGDFENCHPR